MAAIIIFVTAFVVAPLRATAPASPAAFGCSDPPIGYFVDVFATCAECEMYGQEGASGGAWTTWHCRPLGEYYALYVT